MSVDREEASALVEFWMTAGPKAWFAKDADFDARFRERFAAAHEAAACGKLDAWLDSAESALALVLLLDQYPRNSYRGTSRMFETDEAARHAADRAITLGYDRAVEDELQSFFYLPFSHSESLADQERAVALYQRCGPEPRKYAVQHADIVRRFGRFPHRNAVLGRESSAEEAAFLADGGFAG